MWLLQTALSLMHPKQKLMWIAYWATAVPFFEKHIGHAFNLSSEAWHGFLPGGVGLSSERQGDEWLGADWATLKSFQTIMADWLKLNFFERERDSPGPHNYINTSDHNIVLSIELFYLTLYPIFIYSLDILCEYMHVWQKLDMFQQGSMIMTKWTWHQINWLFNWQYTLLIVICFEYRENHLKA